MPPITHLDWWRHKNADRLRLEEELRPGLIETLEPRKVVVRRSILFISYSAGASTPPEFFEKLSRNPAWALNLFAVIRRIFIGRNLVSVAKVIGVRKEIDMFGERAVVMFKITGKPKLRLDWRESNHQGPSSIKRKIAYEFA